MKIVTLFLLFFSFECHAVKQINIDNTKNADEQLREISIYRGKLAQTIIYSAVAYCAKEFPKEEKYFLDAKNAWNKRNLAIIDGTEPLDMNLLLSVGINKKEAGKLAIKIIELQAKELQFNPDDFLRKLSSKPQVKQRKQCSEVADKISSRWFDIPFIVQGTYQSMKDFYMEFPNVNLPSQ
jgi:hypothetical protein